MCFRCRFASGKCNDKMFPSLFGWEPLDSICLISFFFFLSVNRFWWLLLLFLLLLSWWGYMVHYLDDLHSIIYAEEWTQTMLCHLYVQLYFGENEHFAIYYHAYAIHASPLIGVYELGRLCWVSRTKRRMPQR